MLSAEIAEVEQSGVKVNLCISDRATLCLPLHAEEDTLEELRLGDGAYGSTRQGIAPCYGDRVMKKAF
ncbi:adenylosuccinate synthetase [Photobacterium aphoticum]|uniref:Adenylosuccinate synthetase n=1 Tax=Photobacterium aphoticum TaxID=754436 RepID=A0A090RFG2_9GAMM|nr:adenylosuccinate synthetase [Photobacterium aphoticum]